MKELTVEQLETLSAALANPTAKLKKLAAEYESISIRIDSHQREINYLRSLSTSLEHKMLKAIK